MDSLPHDDNAGHPPSSARALRHRQLLDLLLSDAANDVEVVSRELGLQDEMRERLRRALDRMACTQSVLETIELDGTDAGTVGENAELRMREALELLAREWSEENPAGAVEGLLVFESGGGSARARHAMAAEGRESPVSMGGELPVKAGGEFCLTPRVEKGARRR